MAAYQFVNSDEIQEEIVKLGEIVKRDDNHYPDEEFEADNVAVGTGVYRIGDDIYISSDCKHFQLRSLPNFFILTQSMTQDHTHDCKINSTNSTNWS